ncbi:MAG TPA: response regulator transcription factor [Parafilimonas sp.]|nr:response regulator transcription factor [Parafilimonas sp.]
MTANRFLQWQISYFGFEKETQHLLELSIYHDTGLLKKLYSQKTVSTNTYSGIDIHIYFFQGSFNMDTQALEKSKRENVRFLCIGQFNDFDDLLACIQTGSYGCISVINMYEEIVPAIQSVLQNKVYVSPGVAPLVNKYFKEQKDPYSNLLTSKEAKLIQLLTKGALYKEIAWKLRISENTVRSHVRNIYGKMKVHSKTELTRKILKATFNLQLFFCFQNDIACLCY